MNNSLSNAFQEMEVGLPWSAYRCRSQTAHGCCSQKLWYWAHV